MDKFFYISTFDDKKIRKDRTVSQQCGLSTKPSPAENGVSQFEDLYVSDAFLIHIVRQENAKETPVV